MANENYATVAQLKARFLNDAELTILTDNEAEGIPNETVLGDVLDNAEGIADSFVGMKYLTPVPVATLGDPVLSARMKSVVLDLAQFQLTARSGKAPDQMTKLYDDAIVYLTMLSEGKLVLPAATTLATTGARSAESNWGVADADPDTTQRVFSRETMKDL